ncbi:MAG: PQQ-binding-like beta-propeller repeat protein [Opitutae bacterium]
MKYFFFLISLFAVFLLQTSCIRFASPKQTVIKASSTVHLEKKSSDWLFARGDLGMGVSTESGLPDELNGTTLWTYEIQGGGIPVVAGNKVYQFGYYGSGEQVEESLTCLDIESGELIWDKRKQDFISDIVYDRYGVGAACIDPETGNVFFQTSPGLLVGFSPDGSLLWERSLMEEFARLTFPNGRTGGPCVDEGLVILHAITANWGTNGPARDRFYAFDKVTGELVWTSTPGTTPQDSSFAPLVFEDLEDGRRVFYSGTGCGHIVCVDARTGQPLWRFKMSHGGVNAGVVLHEDLVIAVHGKENIDSSRIGRMVGIRKPYKLPGLEEPILELGSEDEAWRNDELESFTSSPVLHQDRVYTSVKTGELFCNDARSGETIWVVKLAPDQIHAAPTWADGKLYIPMFDGHVYVVEDAGNHGKILNKIALGHACLAAPSIAQGKILVQAKNKLYCFGKPISPKPFRSQEFDGTAKSDQIASLQVVPSEFSLSAGKKIKFRVFALDSTGRRIKQLGDGLSWEKWIPPTAKVQAELDGNLTVAGPGSLSALPTAMLSAGAIRVSYEGLSAVTRGRILPALPYQEDFQNGYDLNQVASDGISFSYPPLPWLGARMRWQVQDLDGERVAGNTLDHVLFQRAINFLGSWKDSNYIVEMDAKVDGNRRIKSTIGVINQRYIFALVGNANILQVVSNYDRFKRSVPFVIEANKWYRLKTQIDMQDDGTGLIRAKAWPREDPEPSEWNLEELHAKPHKQGAAGIYALSPQSKKKVYFDNLTIYRKP